MQHRGGAHLPVGLREWVAMEGVGGGGAGGRGEDERYTSKLAVKSNMACGAGQGAPGEHRVCMKLCPPAQAHLGCVARRRGRGKGCNSRRA